MSAPIRLFNLGPSPNSKKVRIALGLKGIPHEVVNIDPADRKSVVEVSGQPLTPVLTHGDTVIFDSAAILRYLDANVKREPRLFSADYDQMKAIEGWESWTRAELAPGIGLLFGTFFAGGTDEAAIQKANGIVNAAGRHIEKSLKPGGYLTGDSPTAADVTAAAFFGPAFYSPEAASKMPLLQFFHEKLKVDPELVTLRKWYQSLDKYDAS
jgi:glutathione S-transferase